MTDTHAHTAPDRPSDLSSSLAEGSERAPAGAVHGATRTARLGSWPPVLACLVGLSSLLLPLSWSGLWAPHELDVADLSRRIAVALHGADLNVPGAENSVPILAELGKGQLPFSSVALGFQLFGLSDWGGRLPLAAWACLGLAATYWLVSRFVDRIAGLYATIVLATTPLYYLQARTMLGDGVTLATVAVSTTGLVMATFHPSAAPAGVRARWLALGIAGLVAGFASRGVWLGVACPALGVGLAWLVLRLAGQRSTQTFGEVAGAFGLLIGTCALAAGAWTYLRGSPAMHLELMGASLTNPKKLPTHDGVLHQLGFGLFPWSAVAPFALALSLSKNGHASPERAVLATCLGSVVAVAIALHGFGAPELGSSPFVATFAVAALIGMAFRSAEQPTTRPRLLALGAAALLVLFYVDLRGAPEQSLQAFSVADAAFPESFVNGARRWIKYGSAAALCVLCLSLGEVPRHSRRAFDADGEATRWLAWLRGALGGRLPWVLGATTLALIALAALCVLERLGVPLRFMAELGGWRRLFEVAWLAVPGAVALPVVGWLARDVVVRAMARLPLPRARVGLVGMAAFGFAMSLGYYPALASHLSPRNVFEAFESRAKSGEPLAVVGEAARVAPYYTSAPVQAPRSPRAAFEWLLAKSEERRWLVLDAKHLAQLNHLYRKRSDVVGNLPVVDAISSEVLLASNRLGDADTNHNPLDAWISTAAEVKPQRPLDVDLEGKLRCHGWAITDEEGVPIDHVRAGRKVQFRIYWEVTSAVSGTWKTFIHIDGQGRRFNGDHDTLEGKYPFRFWQKGDWITDVFPMELERHYAGSTYQVYFGLFAGSKRMKVTRGDHHENRIKGGPLVVH